MQNKIRILGIDPGSNIAGFACIGSKKEVPHLPRDFAILGAGAIRFDKTESHARRIAKLHMALLGIIDEFKPTVCIVEKAFCGVNVSSALKLGEARGALISAIYKRNIDLIEITPREAKKNITGRGQATKEEVAATLKILIGFELGKLPYDVADALALALSHGLRLPMVSATSAPSVKIPITSLVRT